jgi:alanine dehydrogenase
LTPDAVAAIVANGNRVLLEDGAGQQAGFSNAAYSEAGAEITTETKKVFGCPIILKVEPPTQEEITLINPKTVLISALQLKTRQKKLF